MHTAGKDINYLLIVKVFNCTCKYKIRIVHTCDYDRWNIALKITYLTANKMLKIPFQVKQQKFKYYTF